MGFWSSLQGLFTGQTPLQQEAARGNAAAVRQALDHGADANARDNRGRTPLYLATEGGHAAVVGLLLEKGADVNARVKSEAPPTRESFSLSFSPTKTKVEIDPGADIGRTPLHCCAERGHVELVRLLLAHKADISARATCLIDEQYLLDGTPLSVAVLANQVKVARLLIRGGADVNTRCTGVLRYKALLMTDYFTFTDLAPLHLAAWAGHADVAAALLAGGAEADPLAKAGPNLAKVVAAYAGKNHLPKVLKASGELGPAVSADLLGAMVEHNIYRLSDAEAQSEAGFRLLDQLKASMRQLGHGKPPAGAGVQLRLKEGLSPVDLTALHYKKGGPHEAVARKLVAQKVNLTTTYARLFLPQKGLL